METISSSVARKQPRILLPRLPHFILDPKRLVFLMGRCLAGMGTMCSSTSPLSRQRCRRLIAKPSTVPSRAICVTNIWCYLPTLNMSARISIHPSQLCRFRPIHSRYRALAWALVPPVSVCQSRIRLIRSPSRMRLWILTESQLP